MSIFNQKLIHGFLACQDVRISFQLYEWYLQVIRNNSSLNAYNTWALKVLSHLNFHKTPFDLWKWWLLESLFYFYAYWLEYGTSIISRDAQKLTDTGEKKLEGIRFSYLSMGISKSHENVDICDLCPLPSLTEFQRCGGFYELFFLQMWRHLWHIVALMYLLYTRDNSPQRWSTSDYQLH